MRSPGDRIDELIAATTDWRGKTVATLRRVIHDADPGVTEGWKWVTARRPGTPTWEHGGIVCHVNVLKGRVRLTMHEGARLPDPTGLFNASLAGKQRRGIDFHEGDEIDEAALRTLVRAGVDRRLAKSTDARPRP
jgi:hypothetical protein